MSKINKSLNFYFVFFSCCFSTLYAQKSFKAATVGFYNLENIFDTEPSVGYINGNLPYDSPDYHISIPAADTAKYEHVPFHQEYTEENMSGKKIIRPLILQDEFAPNGKKRWTQERYNQKLSNVARSISELGFSKTNDAPVIVGLCEIENKKIVEDLVQQPKLKKYNYGVVHYNSLDARGVDVALIYQKSRFTVTKAKPYVLKIYDLDGSRKYTRDILRVTGILDGEEITFIVNHWPSRSGGEEKSKAGRIAAAQLLKSIFDEIKAENPNAKIIAMGDLNDDPTSTSVKETFHPIGDKEKVKSENDYYNPMIPMYKKGMGTLGYRDVWNLFDQFIMTGSLVDNTGGYKTYEVYKTEIYNADYLTAKEGTYKGYPNRMYGGDTYNATGTSDHYPVYTILLKAQ